MTNDYTEKFYIDDGEPDGLSSPRCFVLGMEYQKVMDAIRESKIDSHPVHRENVNRLTRNLNEMGYVVTVMPNGDDFATIRWIKQ